VRRATRLVALMLLAAPGIVLAAPGVAVAGVAIGTAASKPDVLQAAWFWKTALDQVGAPVAPPAPPPTEPSGVPEGDLAVANTSDDGSSSKTTVLAFQLAAVPVGSTIDKFTVTLTLDSAGTNLNAATAPVVACLPTRLWSAVDGGSFKDAPPVNCTDKAKVEIDGDTYTFDITGIAQSWLADTNLGVAFVNDPANTTTPFQTVFKGAKSVKASMTFTPPVKTGGGTSTGGNGGSTSGTGSSTGGSSTGGSTGGSVPLPPAPPSVDVPLPPPATNTTDPGAGQPPVVAGDTAGSPVTTVAAADPAPSAPTSAFWIAGAALALLLVTAAIVLADQRVPVPTAATTRLSRVLRERERGLDPTAPSTPTTLAPREV
jgi:hypothetical protein